MTPAINRIEPTSGPVGSAVVIYGQNFGAEQGDSVVSLNGVLVDDYGPAEDDKKVRDEAETKNPNAIGGDAPATKSGTSQELVDKGLVGQAAAKNVNPSAQSSLPDASNVPAGDKAPNPPPVKSANDKNPHWSNETITFRVPKGAGPGLVVVTVNGVASNGSSFQVTV